MSYICKMKICLAISILYNDLKPYLAKTHINTIVLAEYNLKWGCGGTR